MHVLISWDVKAKGERWDELNKELKDCLKGFSWVKPLTTVYIVQVDDTEDRLYLKKSISEICRNNPKLINFVITPAMQGGTYGGWLPKSLWLKLKKQVEG